MSISATRRFQYAIGHRVFGHEGKCAHLHGHNFVFFLTAEQMANVPIPGTERSITPNKSYPLDSVGRVIDFGVLKTSFDPWFLTRWDHGMVLWEKDEEAIAACNMISGQKVWRAPFNPTAENMAMYILTEIGPFVLDRTGVRLVKVEVFETENGIAEARVLDE